jgi:competence protein ComEA
MIRNLLLLLMLGFAPVYLIPVAQADEVAAVAQVQTVNINKDDAQTLAARLDGVGRSRAEAIVRYRESFGPFVSVEDLLEVKGVGESILDKNRDRITLE